MSAFRVPLGFGVVALVFYFSTPMPSFMVAGFPVALLGLVFRAAAAGVIQKDTVLAQTGPYRLTRNPLYLGSFLLAAGFAVMSGSLASATTLLIPFVIVYPGVIRKEERHLEGLFGEEFGRFRSRIPPFFPRRLDPRLFEGFSLEQYLSNREYNALAGFVGATAVLLVEMFLQTG